LIRILNPLDFHTYKLYNVCTCLRTINSKIFGLKRKDRDLMQYNFLLTNTLHIYIQMYTALKGMIKKCYACIL